MDTPLLVFGDDKDDDIDLQSARPYIRHTIFVDNSRTADFQTTRGILSLIESDAN